MDLVIPFGGKTLETLQTLQITAANLGINEALLPRRIQDPESTVKEGEVVYTRQEVVACLCLVTTLVFFFFPYFFFLFLFIVGVPRTGIAWLLGPPNEERKRAPIKVWPTLSKLMHKEKNASNASF